MFDLTSLFQTTKFKINPAINPTTFFKPEIRGRCSLQLAKRPLVFLPERHRFEHIFLMGASGKGKTQLLRTMMAQDIANGAGVIFVDPKNDQQEWMLQLATAAGRIVAPDYPGRLQFHSFDLTSPSTQSWNPLAGSDPFAIATRLHEALYADDATANTFYKGVAKSMLTNITILLMAYGKPINLRDLYLAVFHDSLLKRMVRDFQGKSQYQMAVDTLRKFFIEADPREANKLKHGLVVKLEPLLSASWSKNLLSYDSDIVIQDIIDRGEILHFGVGTDKLGKEVYQPIIRLFNAGVKEAISIRFAQGFKRPVFYYCDEFGDVANEDFIAGLKKYRSAGIGFLLGFQDLSDLSVKGDYFLSQTMANCATKIIFNSPGAETAEFMAKTFGTFEQKLLSAQSTDSEGKFKGRSEKLDNRNFKIAPDLIKNMDRGECVALMPYMYRREYAIYKFKATMLDPRNFPAADYTYYRLMWENLPQSDQLGLRMDLWLNGDLAEAAPREDSEKEARPKRFRKKFQVQSAAADEADAPSIAAFLAKGNTDAQE
jgi:type IV secretory pathway TraG/TraD family ATPase VirD4